MLSMSNVSAAQAGTYYEKDGYYVRLDAADNQWQGHLKEELNLSDNVTKADFDTLVNSRKERAGIDLCFSAPKSVSVAALCLDEDTRKEIIAAHEAAVKATLDKIEQREIGARVTPEKHAKQVHVKTGNMICGKFNHYVSRNSDPQLHTHCVIMNQTLYNGKLYAIDNPDLYKNKILYGQLYRSELAAELLKRGFDVERTDLQKGFFELKGVGPEIIENFSTRRTEIVAQLKEWERSDAATASRAAVMTRAAKEHKNLGQLLQSWKETAREIGGVEIERVAGPIIRSDEQKQQEFSEGLNRLARREYAFTEKALKKSVLAAGVASGLNEQDFNRILAENKELVPPLIRRDDLTEKYYSTLKNIATEAEIMNAVSRGRGTMPGIDRARAAAYLKTIENHKAPLSDQQREAVLQIVASKDQCFALQGLAGTGKTYGLKYVREVLENEGYTVTGAALAGKAAHGLEDGSGIKSGTIHSFLNRLEKEAGHAATPDGNYQERDTWNLAGLRPGDTKEAWVFDEASMIDNQSMKHIMDAATAKGAKVVFVGDDKQLPPVGVGNAYSDLIQNNTMNHLVIDEIRRQKDNPELLESVKQAVQGDVGKSFDAQKVEVIAKPSQRTKAIVAEYTALTPEQQAGTVILTADNKARRQINAQIRAELQKKGELPRGTDFKLEDRSGRTIQRELSDGDKIIFLQNDKRIGVMNGQTATIDRIDGPNMTVTSGERKIEIDLDQYKKLDHGYAMTTHKAQGITTDRVLINLDTSQAQMNNRNAYYVDISRARHDVKIFTDDKEKLREQIKDFAHKLTGRDFEPPAKEPERQQDTGPEILTGRELKGICDKKLTEIKTELQTVAAQIDELRQKDIAEVKAKYEAGYPDRQQERLAEIKKMRARLNIEGERCEKSRPHFWTSDANRQAWEAKGRELNRLNEVLNNKIDRYNHFKNSPAEELKEVTRSPNYRDSSSIEADARMITEKRPEYKNLAEKRWELEQQAGRCRVLSRDFGQVPEQKFTIGKGQTLTEISQQIKPLELDMTKGLSKNRGLSRGGMER